MSAIFDTLKLAQGLRGPFTPEQAEHLAAALANSTSETVATKTDIRELRTELKEDMATLRIDLNKAMADLKTEMVRWIVASIAFNFIGTAGLFIAFAKAFMK